MENDPERSDGQLGKSVVSALDDYGIRFAAYVADHLTDSIANELVLDGTRKLVTAAREDEALGVLAGAYLGGQRGVMLMQSSGFALCANVLGSVLLPYQIPVPMIVGLRGQLGEFNVAQVAGGNAVAPICAAMQILYVEPRTRSDIERDLPAALKTCFSTERPVCIGISRGVLS